MSRKTLCAALALMASSVASAWADDDIAWQNESGEVRYWSMRDGQRASETPITMPTEPGWRLAGVGDVNGDRAADMILRHENGDVRLVPMLRGAPGTPSILGKKMGAEWSLVGIGDINGDRTGDIVWANRNGLVDFWSMVRGRFQEQFGFGSQEGPEWRALGVGDVDANGSADIVFQNTSGQVMVWRMDKGRRLDSLSIDRPVGAQWRFAGVGDVNGDDFADIVWHNTNGRVHFWAMFDAQRMGGFDIEARADATWRLVGVADIDRASKSAPALAAVPAEFSVPVETLPLEKARGRFMENAFSAGGYTFASSIDNVELETSPQLDNGPWRARKRAQITYRFLKAEGEVINNGKCIQYEKNWSRFWNRANSLYACEFATTSAASNALEVLLPRIAPQTNAMATLTIEDADKNDARYNIVRARLRYKDVVYEATPISVQPNREGTGRRVVSGHAITRDGKLVGRIAFRTDGVSIGDSLDRQSVLTAPVAESDGREAVIFFAAQLLKMPEVSSSVSD